MLKRVFTKENEVMLGEKKVKIEKITPRKWKELFGVIDTLPNLIIQVITAPREDFVAYLLSAIEFGLDEVIEVVSVLTGIERDYLHDKVGVDELIEYFARMAEYNNLERVLKNVKSLLPFKKPTP